MSKKQTLGKVVNQVGCFHIRNEEKGGVAVYQGKKKISVVFHIVGAAEDFATQAQPISLGNGYKAVPVISNGRLTPRMALYQGKKMIDTFTSADKCKTVMFGIMNKTRSYAKYWKY